MTEEKQEDNFEDELKSIKDEMKELKELLMKKAREEDEEEEINVRNERAQEKDFPFEGVDATIENYLSSVMQGVASNLRSSMEQMASGFQINIAGDLAKAKRDLEKNKHHVEREMRRAKREAERAARKFGKQRKQIFKFQSLSEEELDKFYELAPNLTSALSDEKKLKLLKHLEKGPMYQKDLSETTEIKGGTFKHHMDSLMEVKYVQQEAVRGRYLITQFGIEALKLSEMLFRRYVFATDTQVKEREDESEDGVDVNYTANYETNTDFDSDTTESDAGLNDEEQE